MVNHIPSGVRECGRSVKDDVAACVSGHVCAGITGVTWGLRQNADSGGARQGLGLRTCTLDWLVESSQSAGCRVLWL